MEFGYTIEIYCAFLILCGIVYVRGNNAFQCPISEPCIMMNLEARFNLTRTEAPTQVADPFTLQYAYVLEADCNCYDGTIFSREPSIAILLDSGEKLVFNFSRDSKNNGVNMALDFFLQPSKHFSIPGHPVVQLFSDAPTTLGQRNHSYVCEAPTVVKFSRELDYFMTMTMSNVQIQAYDIKQGKFSPYTECPRDMTTASLSSTESGLVHDVVSADDDVLRWRHEGDHVGTYRNLELDADTIRSADVLKPNQPTNKVDVISFAIGGLVAVCAGLSFVVGILLYLRKKSVTNHSFNGL